MILEKTKLTYDEMKRLVIKTNTIVNRRKREKTGLWPFEQKHAQKVQI